MKKIRGIVLLITVISIFFCGCSGRQSTGATRNAYQYKSNGFVKEGNIAAADDSRAEWVRENMKKMISTEEAELYLGAYYDIAVVDLRSGRVYFSNEAIYRPDSESYSIDQQKNAFSQVFIDYFRKDGAAVTVTSYPECFDANGKDQIKAEVSDNTLFVTYSFGTDMESRIIFQAISKETFTEMEARARQAIEEKKLKSSEWGRMKSAYNHIVYNELSASEKKEYQESYPTFTAGELYVLNAAVTYIQTDNIESVCKKLGYTRADVDREEKKAGKSEALESTIPNFVVTIQYQLDHADLLVSVDLTAIQEPKNFYMNRIYILPAFGAADPKDKGYLFTPDGAGSLIYHNTQSAGSDGMRVCFYGTDAAEMPQSESEQEASASMPVYGIAREDSGIFAIVESNDTISGVDIQLSNQNYAQNMAMPWFYYRIRGSVSNEKVTDTKNYVYSKKISPMPYVVRYHFLYQDTSYNGMAAYYRAYLTQTGGLVQQEGGSRWGMDINVVGGITGGSSIFGGTSAAAASDYQSVLDFVNTLGLSELVVNYEGMFNGGVSGSIPAKLKPVKALGEQETLDKLYETVTVYPALSFMRAAKGGNGLKISTDIAKAINKEYAYQAQYHPNTGLLKKEQKMLLVNPAAYPRITALMLEQYQKLGKQNLLLQNTASLLPSDFNEDGGTTREEGKYYLCGSLQKAKSAGLRLKLEGANSYALPYASSLVNIPVNQDKLRVVGESVPFLGMVLHGSLPYSVAPLNEAEDFESAVLAMLACGANPSWRLITGDMAVLTDTEYTEYYSASADFWHNQIKTLYGDLERFYTAVAEAAISRYDRHSSGLIEISYSNGCKAYINPSSQPLAAGGSTLDGRSYRFYDGNGEEL